MKTFWLKLKKIHSNGNQWFLFILKEKENILKIDDESEKFLNDIDKAAEE